MGLIYESVQGRRTMCPRCRKIRGQVRQEGGTFDSPIAESWWCTECYCVYGICSKCGYNLDRDNKCPICTPVVV